MNVKHRIGRRTWLTRTTTGLVSFWVALGLPGTRTGGNEDTGVLIGRGVGLPTLRDFAGATVAYAQGQDKMLRVDMGFVAAYVALRGGEIAIVDTGTPNNGPKIAEVVAATGLGTDAIRHVILTHHHPDHAGSIAEVLSLAPDATVYAGAADIPRISAGREIRPVSDGDDVLGLQIIATPGHTLGHVSVFDPAGSALITGDAAVNVGGRLASSSPQFTADVAQATESFKKLAGLSFERALFMHGPVMDSGASAAFASVAGGL
ncbi:MAG: MBL fold metallo-hydrolase [Chloroflexota bacterium]